MLSEAQARYVCCIKQLPWCLTAAPWLVGQLPADALTQVQWQVALGGQQGCMLRLATVALKL